ncbi:MULTISPECIES: formate/nitrite transporter family protein [unclassified Acinetobacter]|uniref:formate/nitrite transporter family protein n=1 Tax=unclassified Acinetobacter TaxID=196816 RepID=UPI00190A56BE|nr:MULTISPECIES: formate/nitrite transporter family protein [unclassified Acinetobacter]MBK0065004.1 formate/nitrite transporter family protein [Acinetobacter sp. S55]MBK0065336.1 formate/nitrite transporter family protein [Acinetobacter sp. S54]
MSEEQQDTDSTLTWREKMAIEEHEKLSPRLVYEIIRKDGIEELERPTKALIFSGITAGIVISFSFVFKALLNAYLPETKGSFLIENMGYTVGFVLVILGHMQLFTENTIATVVPLFKPFSVDKLKGVLRLWGIVFISNLIGTALAALFLLNPHLFDENLMQSFDKLAHHVATFTVSENIIKGIPAGILIASLVWILPSANNKFLLIFFITYLMALGGFTHVIVGSAEMAYWVFKGQVTFTEYLFQFLLPTALGNIIGGTGVFTLLIYGQVNEELE